MESVAIEGESPLYEARENEQYPEYCQTRGTWQEIGGPPPKAKYSLVTDSDKYCEGKVKRTPGGE